ncbi:TetR family transcriptional regulator [Novosphingobium sp. FSY-8]|uniref:TetR family transcriptional regulator n=1 Tax=Novosphingobium ovatum TaxID=1908523 RepID=A0ABW9XFT4_9SPHN|nr:TetR/AcrR family transcriptional regulator [Novosphingobium ovatum]NBC37409.1 TetR family transcriptional regulator [Novosphingobium ovatum]
MPRIVDHEQRRIEIAKVVSNLVVKGGAEAVTIRAVAEVCGYSTTIVCHYFRSKHEMLAYTQRRAWERGLSRIRKAARMGKDLPSCLDHALPNTSQRWQDWLCWLAFWGQSPSTEGVEAAWAESVATSHAVFVELIEAAQARGEFITAEDPGEIATEIQLAVNGIATLVAQVRSDWPADRQRAFLRKQLRRLGYRPATETA